MSNPLYNQLAHEAANLMHDHVSTYADWGGLNSREKDAWVAVVAMIADAVSPDEDDDVEVLKPVHLPRNRRR